MNNNIFEKIISNLNIFFRKYLIVVVIFLLVFSVVMFFNNAKEKGINKLGEVLLGEPLKLKEVDIDYKKFCRMNQELIDSFIEIYKIEHGRLPDTIKQLFKDEKEITCPKGGEYKFDKYGRVYCTIHGRLQKDEQ